MSGYTTVNDKAVEALIASELDLIVGELTVLLGGHLRCILLTGGFGRGEGGVLRDSDKLSLPANDYDILVVVDNAADVLKAFSAEITALKERINQAVSVKQVDLVFKSSWFFWLPGYKVVHYENKYGSTVLWGKFVYPWPIVPPGLLPRIEGTTYFRTRGGGLLIAALLLDSAERLDGREETILAMLEMNKAWLAIGDALLIKYHRYHFSYRERLRRFESFPDIDPLVKSAYKRAVERKLLLSTESINRLSLAAEWPILSSTFSDAFLDFESHRLGKTLTVLEDYEQACTGNQTFFALTMERLKSNLNSEFSNARCRDRIVVMLLLRSRVRHNESDLRRAAGLLGHSLPDGLQFADLWRDACSAYLKQWHLDGIVSTLVNQP